MDDAFLHLLYNIGADGPAVANSTVETSILPDAKKILLAPDYYNDIEQLLRFRCWGRISLVGGGTLRLRLFLGANAVFDSGLMPMNASAKTNVPWKLDLDATVRALGKGTSANMMVQGTWQSEAVIGAPAATAGGAPAIMLPYNANPVVGSGYDSTQALELDLRATWSSASASNSIQVTQGGAFGV